MSWLVVGREDAAGLRGSRRTKLLLGVVAFAFVLGGYLLPMVQEAPPTTADYAGSMVDAVTLLVPLVGLLLGHRAIVGERESGRLTLLLSLPHDRRDVVVGKFLGRSLALGVGVTAGVLLGSALVDYPFGSFEAGTMLAYLLVTLLYGTAFVGVGLAISTATTSNAVATSAAFGVFFLFVGIWSQLRGLLLAALRSLGLAEAGLPDWALLLYGAEPGLLYRRAVDGFFAGVAEGPYLGPDAPWYLGEWLAVALLAVWALGPVTLGYLRFRSTDL
jgi:ABC-2 type transport system permease protein